jgi:hypothetical protein
VVQRKFKFRWFLYALVALVYLPTLPSCMITHDAKFGRVVDSKTGDGIAGAFVIAVGSITGSGSMYPESHTATEVEYRFVAVTAADGSYRIPGSWDRMSVVHLLPLLQKHELWEIVVVKPGYVMESDVRAWAVTETNGVHPNEPFMPFYQLPTSVWLGPVVRVSSIPIEPAEMNATQAALYYGYLLTPGSALASDTRNISPVRRALNEWFEGPVCAMPKDRVLTFSDYAGVLALLDDPTIMDPVNHQRRSSALRKKLFDLEPAIFQTRRNEHEIPAFKMSHENASLEAGHLCDAMHSGDTVP